MMTELKTLNDMEKRFNYIRSEKISFEEEKALLELLYEHKLIRQEAIKWAKAFNKGECWTDFAADERKGQENIEEWIQHFFNITEKDLK